MNGICATANNRTASFSFQVQAVAWASFCLILAPGCVSGPPRQVLIRPPSSSPVAETELNAFERKPLKVTTFNVWGLPKWLNGASSDRYDKIARQLEQIGSDVVLLQEVWTRRSFTELSGGLKDSNHTWWTAAARHQGTFLGQNGLLTLSRYPITGAEFKHFSTARLPDSLMHKGALKITIRLADGRKFNIWNVHLQDGKKVIVRERQISELVSWIKNAHDGQVADIVGGDFNALPDTSDFNHLLAAIGPEVHQLAGEKPFPTWDGLKLGPEAAESLDHIFIRLRQPEYEIAAKQHRRFEAQRPQDRLSDHMAMEAALTFRNVLEAAAPVLLGQTTETASLDSPVLTAQ